MANRMYPLAKKAFEDGDIDLLVADIKVVLIDTADYTYNAADEFLDDVAGAAIVATSANLGTKTTTSGVFDAADTSFTAVTGDVCEALIIYVDTGSAATSRLVAYIDTSITGMPVTPNGGNINLAWNASGIFAFTDV